MARPPKRITALQAAKILGVTSENIRLLSRMGILSSIVVDTGNKRTRYYLESEIKQRKSASKEYIETAKNTDDILAEAKRLNEEASKEEAAARARYKASKRWMSTQKRLSEIICAVLNGYDNTLSERESRILRRFICLDPIEHIASHYALSQTRVSQIVFKSIRKMIRCKSLVESNKMLREEKDELIKQNRELKSRNEYLLNFANAPVRDNNIMVLSEKEYIIRKVLMLPVDEIRNGWSINNEVVAKMKENGLNTLADLVVLSDYDFKKLGLQKYHIEIAIQRKGLALGMNIAKYGLGNEAQIRRENDKLNQRVIDDPVKAAIRQKLLSPIVDYGLSVRAYNCLKAAGVETFADLCICTRFELMKFRNFGRKSLNEIDMVVERMGLNFGMDLTEYGIVPQKKR